MLEDLVCLLASMANSGVSCCCREEWGSISRARRRGGRNLVDIIVFLEVNVFLIMLQRN